MVRWDVPFCETRVGFKRALWAVAYRCTAGGVHRTASPLKPKSRSRLEDADRRHTSENMVHVTTKCHAQSRPSLPGPNLDVTGNWKLNELLGKKEISSIGSISMDLKLNGRLLILCYGKVMGHILEGLQRRQRHLETRQLPFSLAQLELSLQAQRAMQQFPGQL